MTPARRSAKRSRSCRPRPGDGPQGRALTEPPVQRPARARGAFAGRRSRRPRAWPEAARTGKSILAHRWIRRSGVIGRCLSPAPGRQGTQRPGVDPLLRNQSGRPSPANAAPHAIPVAAKRNTTILAMPASLAEDPCRRPPVRSASIDEAAGKALKVWIALLGHIRDRRGTRAARPSPCGLRPAARSSLPLHRRPTGCRWSRRPCSIEPQRAGLRTRARRGPWLHQRCLKTGHSRPIAGLTARLSRIKPHSFGPSRRCRNGPSGGGRARGGCRAVRPPSGFARTCGPGKRQPLPSGVRASNRRRPRFLPRAGRAGAPRGTRNLAPAVRRFAGPRRKRHGSGPRAGWKGSPSGRKRRGRNPRRPS